MILITLGSQKFQFNRLLKAIDEQVATGKINDEIFAQIGASDYLPRHYKYKDFIDRDVFSDYENRAEIIITHGGTGTIVGAVKAGKKVIAVPRLAKYGEHVDDHQLQVIDQFAESNLICKCDNCDEIWRCIETVRKTTYSAYNSNTVSILKSINQYLREIRK